MVYQDVHGIVVPIAPGGYTVGGLLLLNLLAAHIRRFSLTWKKSGIFLAHFGLILLLIGELLSGLWQEDFYLRLDQGETKNYAESHVYNELAIIDTTDAKTDFVVAIPESLLAKRGSVQHPKLPFRVDTKIYYPNSSLFMQGPSSPPSPATTGMGLQVVAAPQPVTYKQSESNSPSAYVELIGTDGTIGTYLVSSGLGAPQPFNYGGRTWTLSLRAQRLYKPFSLTLLKFSHDRYAGTEIPKNFSSRLRLNTPDGHDDREVLVYMNNPLRYAGLTFYQAGFENNDRTSVLQVVRNPSWLIPYVACSLISLGLLIQFGIHLAGFINKRLGKATVAA
ncbi:MAG: cytochrome c biogenesis protein ResB [Nibricoccus sp.]